MSRIAKFIVYVNGRFTLQLSDFAGLYDWSVACREHFWEAVWNFSGVIGKIREIVRENCSPRHVPAKIVQMKEIPRTKSGKIVELAVREVVHGRVVKNISALANPEALKLYENLEVLQ